jgi:hypothetical protein
MATTISGSTGVTYPNGGVDNTTGAGVGTTDTQTLTNKTLGSGLVAGASLITSGTAVASTSGTSIDFTGIPSWVKRITVMFNAVSTNGTTYTQLQVGTPTIVTTGYVGGAYNGGGVAFSTGFYFSQSGSAADTRSGIATLANLSGNTWVCSGATGVNGGGGSLFGGVIVLGAALSVVRITANGTDTFDAGSINIMYE